MFIRRLLVIAFVASALLAPRFLGPSRAGDPPPPPTALNHFLCYQISRGAIRETVTLTTNQFGSSSAVVRRAQRLCAPANKENEDPTAPGDVDHLTGYYA